jgi:hypothetical protein
MRCSSSNLCGWGTVLLPGDIHKNKNKLDHAAASFVALGTVQCLLDPYILSSTAAACTLLHNATPERLKKPALE